MFWAIVGAGRTAARPGGQRQAPRQWGWFGKTIALALMLGTSLALSWRATVIVLAVLTTLTILLAVCCAPSASTKRERRQDPLAELADLLGKDGRK